MKYEVPKRIPRNVIQLFHLHGLMHIDTTIVLIFNSVEW